MWGGRREERGEGGTRTKVGGMRAAAKGKSEIEGGRIEERIVRREMGGGGRKEERGEKRRYKEGRGECEVRGGKKKEIGEKRREGEEGGKKKDREVRE